MERVKDINSITYCYSCKTCVSSCPVSYINPKFNPFGIVKRLAFWGSERLLKDPVIWLCTGCYICQERCPQGIKLVEIFTELKNRAYEKGYFLNSIKDQRDIILNKGRIYPLDDFDNKKRKKMGLPELPTEIDITKRLFSLE